MLQIFMSCCGLLFVQTLYDIFHTHTLRQYHSNNIKLFLCHLLSHYILLILIMNQKIYFHRQHIFLLLLDINHVWYLCLAAIMVFRPTNIPGIIYNLARYGLKMKVFQILHITIIHAVCLCSPFCVSERGKLCHTYSMFMFQILCIRKVETVSYLHYDLYFVYKKEGNCIIPTVCV